MRCHKCNVIDSDWNQIALESDYPGDVFGLLGENKDFSVLYFDTGNLEEGQKWHMCLSELMQT